MPLHYLYLLNTKSVLNVLLNYFCMDDLALDDNIPCIDKMLRVILYKLDLEVKTARTQKMF